MSDGYEPSSDFLIMVINEEVPLTGSEFGEANQLRVIDLVSDEDAANRDWATFILGNSDLDNPAIRAALLIGAADTDARVRAEAIRGLARKDRVLALPFVLRALADPAATVNVLEAAAIVAHPSLVENLEAFSRKGQADWVDELIADALVACRSGEPDARYA